MNLAYFYKIIFNNINILIIVDKKFLTLND